MKASDDAASPDHVCRRQYAKRSFYELFGFERVYEGDEFPGFLAIRHGEAVIGLQRASPEQPGYTQGLRWQFELTGGTGAFTGATGTVTVKAISNTKSAVTIIYS